MDELLNLRSEHQLCIPLFSCYKLIIQRYKPFLEEVNLNYPQFIIMLTLYEKKEITIRNLEKHLKLDPRTLLPLLKELKKKGYINKSKDSLDERSFTVSLTKEAIDLKRKIISIPSQAGKSINLNEKESMQLYDLLYKVIDNFDKKY